MHKASLKFGSLNLPFSYFLFFLSSFCWRWIMFQTFLLGSPVHLASRLKSRGTSTGTGLCVCLRLGRRSLRYQKDKVSSNIMCQNKQRSFIYIYSLNIKIKTDANVRWKKKTAKLSIFQTQKPSFQIDHLEFFVYPKSLSTKEQYNFLKAYTAILQLKFLTEGFLTTTAVCPCRDADTRWLFTEVW